MPRSVDGALAHFSADDIRQKLRQYDRTPFLDLLAAYVECAPTPEAMEAFATKYPDRYINALTALGRLAGFTEKREVEFSGNVNVRQLSDSQLEDRLNEMAAAIGAPMIDLKAIKVTERAAGGEAPGE